MKNRQITLIRKKTLFNNSTTWYIQIDGRNYDVIHGGESKKILLDQNRHLLSVYFNDSNIGKVDKVFIPEGTSDYVYHLSLSSSFMGNAFKNYIKIQQL